MNGDLQRLRSLSTEKRALLALRRMQSKLKAIEENRTESIAIIGVGCRFPGGANDPVAFWEILRDGIDTITEIPSDRWDLEAYYDPNPEVPDKMATRWGGFLQHVDQFDPTFFGISPREALSLDPQQRLLLEVAWEALEHAGQPIDQLAGSQTGVFVGISNSDHFHLQVDNNPITDAYLETGNRNCFAAGRLCYVFNFRGPAVALDTVSSSSLVSVHMACQSLRSGECRMALAGGVNLILSPLAHIMVTKWGLMAPDGRCKTFDARANGFVRSEGCGLVVLKRLSDALADGDPILALIRGSAVNQDGRSNGLTAPNGQAQQALVRQALAMAGVDPAAIGYVEAHGTGSKLGDTIEVESLAAVVGRPQADAPVQPCALGAVKTNIGHLEAAAGVAGLIKAVLVLRHGVIPPNLHFETLNPHIKLDHTRFVIPTAPQPWPADRTPRYAGVNSFGFSGTNAHVVLEEYAPVAETRPIEPAGRPYLLPLSAHTSTTLTALAKSYQALLTTPDAPALHDLCYTASLRRTHHTHHRLALVGTSTQVLAESLAAFLRGEAAPGVTAGDGETSPGHQLVFVFPGQGSQWFGMGRQLLDQEPVFRAAIEECDAVFRAYVDWSLVEQLLAEEQASRLDDIDVVQPALFAIQIALAALWRSWGIIPTAVVGHSMGEVAAAYVAGILSLADAARIICCRSRLLRRVRGQGAMLLAEISVLQAQELLAPYADQVSVAVSNSARSTVLSGDPTILKLLQATLESQAVFCRWVKVDVASHSPQVDPLRDDLLAALQGIEPQAAAVPLYSTVTNTACAGPELDAAYWVRNLRETVLFGAAIQQLIGCGQDHFLEVSAHPILLPAIKQGFQEHGRVGLALQTLQRETDARTTLLNTLGVLYTAGYPVVWPALYPNKGQPVRLPAYPWQRQRYWMEAVEGRAQGGWRNRQAGAQLVHPLLGAPLQLATAPDIRAWEGKPDLKQLTYLADYQVQGVAVLPLAAYIEMSIAAANAVFGLGAHVLSQVTVHRTLELPADAAVKLQVVLTIEDSIAAKIRIFSRFANLEQADWKLHISAAVRRADLAGDALPGAGRIADIQARCSDQISGEAHYRSMAALGLQYGPGLRGVVRIWRGADEALARVRMPEKSAGSTTPYHVHPALLDACLQAFAAIGHDPHPQNGQAALYLPVEFQQAQLFQRPGGREVWVHVRRSSEPGPSVERISGDLDLFDEDGQLLLKLRGACLQRQEPSGRGHDDHMLRWMYAIQWQQQALPPVETRADTPGTWIIFADRQGVGTALCEQLTTQGQRVLLVVPETGITATGGVYQLNSNDPAAYATLLQSNTGAHQPPCRGIIHLWSLNMPSGGDPAGVDSSLGWASTLSLVQAMIRLDIHARLWLVTRGVQPVGASLPPVAVEQAPLWGLGLTIAHEHPELRCSRVDLNGQTMPAEAALLLAEFNAPIFEDQVALRPDGRYVARLVPWLPAPDVESRFLADDQPFQVEIADSSLPDRLTLRAAARRAPDAGEVEIRVEAAGLSFPDMLLARDGAPDSRNGTGPILGSEFAGSIVAVGPNVTDLQVGQEVIALTPGGLCTFITTDRRLVVPKPNHLSFVEAATIPAAFLTAYYALCYVAHLEPDERILIHAAAGGIGLAAIQLAQRAGAEIFATAASPEQRALLQSVGVRHVFDSGSLTFADEIRAVTAGEGIDVVLNSLTGEFIPASLSLLRAHGRFIELGQHDDMWNGGLKPSLKNLLFAPVDPGGMLVQRPDFVRRLLHEVMALFERRELTPIVQHTVPVDQSATVFQTMAQAKHFGKIAISFAERAHARIAPAKESVLLRANGTYLITDGTGGIGLQVARWLVEQGARHLVLIERQAPEHTATPVLDELGAQGAMIVVHQVDVADRAAMAALFTSIKAEMPPLRGIIHTAAVLDNCVLAQQTPARFERALAPKVAGAWNLHHLTLDQPLDFFVLFSSAVTLVGAATQGSYAAANAFLDTLAYYRQGLGRPALSINWGSWAEVAPPAQNDRVARPVTQGISSLTVSQGLEALGQLLRQAAVRAGVMAFNLRQWQQAHPITMALPLFAELREHETPDIRQRSGASALRADLQAAAVGQRWGLLETYLRDQTAQILGLDPRQIGTRKPFATMGFDSLTALELRNRLEVSLDLILPGTLIWGYPTINALVPHLAEKMEIPLNPAQESRPERVEEPQPLPEGDLESITTSIGLDILNELDQLSDDQVRLLLSES